MSDIWRRLVKPFSNMKIRAKFLLSYLIIIMVTVSGISLASYYVSVNSIKNVTYTYSENWMSQIGINLQVLTKEVEEALLLHFRAPELVRVIQSSKERLTENELAYREREINQILTRYMLSRDYFTNAWLVEPDGSVYEQQRSQVETDFPALLGKSEYIDRIKHNWGRTLWMPGEQGEVIVMRAMYDLNSYKYVGIVAASVRTTYLKRLYEHIDPLQGGQFYLFDDNGTLLVSDSGDATFFIGDVLANNKQLLDSSASSFRYGGREYITTYNKVPGEIWHILNVVSVDNLSKHTDPLKYWIGLTMGVAILVALIIAITLSHQITTNVRHLVESMKQISYGKFDTVVVPKGNDEIALLGNKFNLMSQEIQKLIETVYEESTLKQNAEFKALQFEYKALQAQINPHFLYNTLEFINNNAMLNETEKVSRVVLLLGSMLRKTFRNRGDTIALAEELNYIETYLEIYKIVYGDKIIVEYDLDRNLLQHWVPKFILQPIVENTIIHGMDKMTSLGTILIEVSQDLTDISIRIIDNGMGISPDKLEQLNRELDSRETVANLDGRIGLNSVDKRIKLMYGSKYGITISSTPMVETIVEIRLPMEEEQNL